MTTLWDTAKRLLKTFGIDLDTRDQEVEREPDEDQKTRWTGVQAQLRGVGLHPERFTEEAETPRSQAELDWWEQTVGSLTRHDP